MSNLMHKDHLRILRASESFYSEQTGMLHLSYNERPFKRGDTIPLYHNFLYVLALLQNKEKETMQKAIHLMDHLLYFQIREGEDLGAFPRYLHEYPKVERRYEVVDILLPLIWIYRDFRAIFPEYVRLKLLDAIKIAAQYLFACPLDREPSYLLKLQLGCLAKALGKLLEKNTWVEYGEETLQKLFAKGSDKSWGSSRHLSKMMLYLELLSVEEEPYIGALYYFVRHSWHESTSSYLGPGINEHLYQNKQEPTLYHDLLSRIVHQKNYPLLEADIIESVLLRNGFLADGFVKKKSLKYTLEPFDVEDLHDRAIGYSLFNLPEELWEKRGGFYPFKLLIENKGQDPHSFALHMGSFVQIERLSEHSVLFTFENSSESELDISFYGNLSSGVQITKGGKKATMFDLSSAIEFDYGDHKVILKFPNGEEHIWAHVCRGNRKSQIAKECSTTYDWNLYFRQVGKDGLKPFLIELEIGQK